MSDILATITHRGQTRTVPVDEASATLAALVTDLGPYEPGVTCIETHPTCATIAVGEPIPTTDPVVHAAVASFDLANAREGAVHAYLNDPTPAAPVNSTWGALVTDDVAKARIESQGAALAASGIQVDRSEQLFATGTRMADVGYDTQRGREREHAALRPARDLAAEFIATIEGEKRRQHVVTAGDFGRALQMNGRLSFDGYTVQAHALRGLLTRLGSPAGRYVFGLRDRMRPDEDAEYFPTHPQIQADKAAILDCLQRECSRFPDVKLSLRMRDGLQDIFAMTSPGYGLADAPSVLPDVLRSLPADAKGAAIDYNAATTDWQFRASVFTPTPADEHAVGEAFQGFQTFGGNDAGGGRLWSGGWVEFLRCLNASLFQVDTAGGSRVHRKNVLLDLATMVRESGKAIHALCEAWGTARADVIELPSTSAGLVPIETAIPGFYRAMLTARKGELVGVLPGRVETHVPLLARTFTQERRNPDDVTRADLANGVTRYLQTQPQPVQRAGEAAIGAWLVNGEHVGYAAA